ncbi:hypothetical protein U91I_02055 [alpha proteobacterium U9-1i]|nr:hypothetical protein U91I_02055 [alpha proteobacterium U9-1i]
MGKVIASAAIALIVSACAHETTPQPNAVAHFAVEPGSNAVSVWGGAFRINGGADWTLEQVSGDDRAFAATYRAGALRCHFSVTNAPDADGGAQEINAQTLERTRAEREQLAATARRISPLSERRTGTALVLVWDWQDANGRYHVRNQAALQPMAGGRTVLAAKACESSEALDASSAAVNGLRAEFNFQSPYWAP